MIPRILLADAAAILRLRREALEREPLAFSSSPAEDRMQAGGALEEYLAKPANAIFGAFEPDLVGMTGIARRKAPRAAIRLGCGACT
jgi:hypothetical protein